MSSKQRPVCISLSGKCTRPYRPDAAFRLPTFDSISFMQLTFSFVKGWNENHTRKPNNYKSSSTYVPSHLMSD